MRGKAAAGPGYVQRTREELVAAHEYTLLSSYAELFIANMMEPSADHLKEKLDLNERALHFIPIAPVVYRQAWLLALADRPDEARAQLERAIWAYPADYRMARGELDGLVRKDPARFSALLEFATQKIEEYRRAAVPAK
jgi:tetratricopeptide (TPR) repeat protein